MGSCQTPNVPSNAIIFPEFTTPVLEMYLNRGEKLEEAYQLLLLYLVSIRECQTLDRHRVYLHQLNEDKVRAILGSAESFNVGIHQQLGCLVQAVISHSTSIFTLPERITSFFPRQPRALSYSLYKATVVLETNDIFVIKNDHIKKDNILFEAAIGMIVGNHLRTLIPNFMYTYGIFQCLDITSMKDNKVFEWCARKGQDPYLVLEKIRYGITLDFFVKHPGITSTDLLAILYQMFNALYLAQRLWGFVHGDLHVRNWLIREMREPIVVPYYGVEEKATRWIVTRYVPCIIDYGFSRATIGGVEIVPPVDLGENLRDYYPEERALHDFYNLVIDAQVVVEDYLPLDYALELMHDFINERTDKIQTQYESGVTNITPLSLNDAREFILFAESIAPPPVVSSIPKEYWSFQDHQSPITDCNFYARFGTPKALSAFAYCQTLNAAKAVSPAMYNTLRREINFYNATGVFQFEFIPRFKEFEKEFYTKLNQNPFIPAIQEIPMKALDDKFKEDYMRRINVLDNIFFQLQDLKLQLKANECALAEQEVPPASYRQALDHVKSFFTQAQDIFYHEHHIINDNNRIAKEKDIQELIIMKMS